MKRLCLAAALLATITSFTPIMAGEPGRDNSSTDPARMGWMKGSPPPADKTITFESGDHLRFPQIRWAVAHYRELLPTAGVPRGHGPVSALPLALREDIDDVTFLPIGSDKPMTWAQSLDANYTDAILILHKGRIVYERYFGVMTRDQPHLNFSVTKSYTGTLAAILIEEGKLDETAPVARYTPELKNSGFGNATVRQILDMTPNIAYSETYAANSADFARYTYAAKFGPRPKDYEGPTNLFDFLKTIKPAGPHGQHFSYASVNTDILGLLIARVTGKPLQTVLSERIWQPLGMENDASFTIDEQGTAMAGGGLSSTLRDQARFGEMMRLGGKFNGRQVVPESIIADIRKGGNKDYFAAAGYKALPNWSYRGQWWVNHNADGAFSARGVLGQAIYVDPKAEMVIVRFASGPQWSNSFYDPTTLPAYQAIADKLKESNPPSH